MDIYIVIDYEWGFHVKPFSDEQQAQAYREAYCKKNRTNPDSVALLKRRLDDEKTLNVACRKSFDCLIAYSGRIMTRAEDERVASVSISFDSEEVESGIWVYSYISMKHAEETAVRLRREWLEKQYNDEAFGAHLE